MAANADGIFKQQALPTEVVDTLGAGDGFIAACLVAQLRGASVQASLQAGAVQAANDRARIVLDDGTNLARANLAATLFPSGGLSAASTLRAGDVLTGPLVGVLSEDGVAVDSGAAYVFR